MRVALLSVSDKLGGSEAMLVQIVREVTRVRPEWRFVAVLPGAGPLAGALEAEGVTVCAVRMPPALLRLGEWGAAAGRQAGLVWRLATAGLALPGYQRRLSAALAALEPDVMHSNGFKAHVVAARAASPAARVWHIHEYIGTRPLTRRLLRHHARRADAIVANSASVARDVSQGLDVEVTTVLNAVDVERFSPAGDCLDLDAAAGLPPAPTGTIRVGLVGTFSRWKGHETFLRALALLPGEAPVRGYIIGGPVYDTAGSQHDAESLRSLAGSLGLDGRVGLTGFLSPVESALRALDVVVHASTDPEPFGLVITEGMACGRPVVTSGTGGSSELIVDGKTALQHVPGDSADLARALRRLAADSALRARLGAGARAHAVALFDARRLGEQFAAVYERAVMGRARR
jgi:glycosyltransferase involved in cell wall biosynthesis